MPTLERPASAISGSDAGGNWAAEPQTAKRNERKGGVVKDMLTVSAVAEHEWKLERKREECRLLYM